jgi:hypothetical protein
MQTGFGSHPSLSRPEVLGEDYLMKVGALVVDRMKISLKAATSHVDNIYRKLGVTTRAAATLKAMQLSLVS